MRLAHKSARERILETADDLFYREGIHAVGIDTIIEKSGVAKMSLYRNFASKDDLVSAYLEARGQRYWKWWEGVMARNANEPRRQLRDLFEAIAVRARRPEFLGCALMKAAAEFPEEDCRARVVALAHKKELRNRLRRLCRTIGAQQPDVLSSQLLMLIEGAYSTAGILGKRDAVKATAKAAEVLIEAAIAGPSAAD
jgi:AcrR family transcriptional regulator